MAEFVEASRKKRIINLAVDILVIGLLIEFTIRIESMLIDGTPMQMLRLFFVFGGYRIPMEYYLGKTVGKYVTRTRVVDEHGNKIGFEAAVKRSLCRWIPFEVFSLGLGADAKAWHDTLSKTHVIDEVQSPVQA